MKSHIVDVTGFMFGTFEHNKKTIVFVLNILIYNGSTINHVTDGDFFTLVVNLI